MMSAVCGCVSQHAGLVSRMQQESEVHNCIFLLGCSVQLDAPYWLLIGVGAGDSLCQELSRPVVSLHCHGTLMQSGEELSRVST